MEKLRICITGASGYLARMLIERLERSNIVEYILCIDSQKQQLHSTRGSFYRHIQDPNLMLDPLFLSVLSGMKINTVVHMAWIFNPTHDPELEHRVNILGTENVFRAARAAGVKKIVYVGSTTSYGAVPRSEKPIKETEDDEIRGEECPYPYSRHKAMVDKMFRQFIKESPSINCVLIKGSIVAGPNTRNVVSQMASLPVMPRVAGHDPQMQFISEDDMTEILALATLKPIKGVFNAAGDGTLRYSEVAEILGRPCVSVPGRLLYPMLGATWHLRLMPFPPSILDLISYPWLGDNSKLKEEFVKFGFKLRYTSRDAIEMLAEGLRSRK